MKSKAIFTAAAIARARRCFPYEFDPQFVRRDLRRLNISSEKELQPCLYSADEWILNSAVAVVGYLRLTQFSERLTAIRKSDSGSPSISAKLILQEFLRRDLLRDELQKLPGQDENAQYVSASWLYAEYFPELIGTVASLLQDRRITMDARVELAQFIPFNFGLDLAPAARDAAKATISLFKLLQEAQEEFHAIRILDLIDSTCSYTSVKRLQSIRQKTRSKRIERRIDQVTDSILRKGVWHPGSF